MKTTAENRSILKAFEQGRYWYVVLRPTTIFPVGRWKQAQARTSGTKTDSIVQPKKLPDNLDEAASSSTMPYSLVGNVTFTPPSPKRNKKTNQTKNGFLPLREYHALEKKKVVICAPTSQVISRLLEDASPVGTDGAIARVEADPLYGVQVAVKGCPMDWFRPKVVLLRERQAVRLHQISASMPHDFHRETTSHVTCYSSYSHYN